MWAGNDLLAGGHPNSRAIRDKLQALGLQLEELDVLMAKRGAALAASERAQAAMVGTRIANDARPLYPATVCHFTK